MKKTLIFALTGASLITGAGVASAGPQPWDSKITHVQISSDRGGITLKTDQANQPGQQTAKPYANILTAFNVKCNADTGKCGTLYHKTELQNGAFHDTATYPKLTVSAQSLGSNTAKGMFTTGTMPGVNQLPDTTKGVIEMIGEAPGQQCDAMYKHKIKLVGQEGSTGALYLCYQ